MRFAVVSDIHANVDALEAALADAGQVDQIWCLGDIVDMGPQPNECLEILRDCGAVCIFGNHEEWVSGNRPPRLRETPLEEWALWTYERLSPIRDQLLAIYADWYARDGITGTPTV